MIELIFLVWLTGVIGIWIMKKLKPEGYVPYMLYVLAVVIAFTIFVILHICQMK